MKIFHDESVQGKNMLPGKISTPPLLTNTENRGQTSSLTQTTIIMLIVGIATILIMLVKHHYYQKKEKAIQLQNASLQLLKIESIRGSLAECLDQLRLRSHRCLDRVTIPQLLQGSGSSKTPLPFKVEIVDPLVSVLDLDGNPKPYCHPRGGSVIISDCKRLTKINISGRGMSNVNTLSVENCPSLEALNIETNEEKLPLSIDIKSCPKLRVIVVENQDSESKVTLTTLSCDDRSASGLKKLIIDGNLTNAIDFLEHIEAPKEVIIPLPFSPPKRWLTTLVSCSIKSSDEPDVLNWLRDCTLLESLIMQDFPPRRFPNNLVLPKSCKTLTLLGWDNIIDLSPIKQLPITTLCINKCGGWHNLTPLADHPTLKALDVIACDRLREVIFPDNSKIEECRLVDNRSLVSICFKSPFILQARIQGNPCLESLAFVNSAQLTKLVVSSCPLLNRLQVVQHENQWFEVERPFQGMLHEFRRECDGTIASLFSPTDWEKSLDIQLLGPRQLPDDLKRYLNENCPFTLGKKVQETHFLTFVPGPINLSDGSTSVFSLKILQDTLKLQNPQPPMPQEQNTSDIRNKEEAGYWVLAAPRTYGYPEAFDKWLETNRQERCQQYNLPNSIECFAIMLARFLARGERSKEMYSTDSWQGAKHRTVQDSSGHICCYPAHVQDSVKRNCSIDFTHGKPHGFGTTPTRYSLPKEFYSRVSYGKVTPVRHWFMEGLNKSS